MGDYEDFCESFGGDAGDPDFMDNWLYENVINYHPQALKENKQILNERNESLHFSTDRNPRKNTISKGYEMQKKFTNSSRWELLDEHRGGDAKNDHDFHHNGSKIWRDINNGTLVKESFSTNRRGIINSVNFQKISEYPESERN